MFAQNIAQVIAFLKLNEKAGPVLSPPQLVERSPIVADVRGKGLLVGIELAKEGTREPLAREQMREIFTQLLGRGLLVMPSGSSLRINPPLTLSKELADAGCDVLEEVLAGAPVAAAGRA